MINFTFKIIKIIDTMKSDFWNICTDINNEMRLTHGFYTTSNFLFLYIC